MTATPEWTVVNFSHPLTGEQLAQVAALAGGSIGRVIDVPVQFDEATPFAEQAVELLAGIDLSPTAWQQLSILVNPPAFAPITALVLAGLHALMGHFPTVIRVMRVDAVFEVAEILDLQQVRDTHRRLR